MSSVLGRRVAARLALPIAVGFRCNLIDMGFEG